MNKWLRGDTLARLAELIAVNGGRMIIDGLIGQPCSSDTNRYGRIGLTVPEAFELTYMRGIFDALCSSESEAKAAQAAISREIAGEIIEIPSPEMRKKLLG